MTSVSELWSDRDKRRAALTSLLLHGALLLVVALWVQQPQPVPLDSFIVIDVGTPAESAEVEPAAAADAPAPTAPTPQVAADTPGAPVAQQAPQPEPAAPEAQPETAQPVAPPPQAAAEAPAEPTPEAAPTPEAVAAPAQATPQPVSETPPEPLPRPAPPAPVAPTVAAEPLPSQAAPELPDVEAPQLEPRPLAEPLEIPQPTATVAVPEARSVEVTPSATVAAPQAIPSPQASVATATAQPIPAPQATAAVAAPQAIPSPQVAVSAGQARPVPTPAASAAVAVPQAIPSPQVAVSAGQARDVAIQPQLALPTSVRVPSPQVSAEVRAPEPAPGAPADTRPDAALGAATTPSNISNALPPGGNADASGQPDALPEAAAGNLGRAASPDGSADPTGAPAAPVPYTEARLRPVAVLIDNVNGYPQSGLAEAGLVAEMPVEGGLTRLMTVFDRTDPGAVGPVRSARDYFVELADSLDAVLVHDGGSPGALAAIARIGAPTLNAFDRGELFSRSGDRSAPYNLYSGGGSLRDALSRLSLERSRTIQGTRFRPAADAPTGAEVTVRYSGAYGSGFRYVPEFDRYRWVRAGQPAVDAAGDAVLVDAVLVARIDARPLPGDPEGRLYIPLRGGSATLFLRGRAVEGSWSRGGSRGVVFTTADGLEVDLRPFRSWLLFAPETAEVAQR